MFNKFRPDKTLEFSTVEEQKIGVGLEFCGVRYRAVESGEYLDQDVYVHNKLEN